MGAGSSRTSTCASVRDVGVGAAGAVVGQCASGRLVAVSLSASTSAGGRAPGSVAGDVNGSDCG